MFEKGGYIVYGTTGVCEIEDITSPNIEGVQGNRLYYVLNPCFKKGNRIFTPVDNEKVVIRAVMTQEEAASLVDEIPHIEELWEKDDKDRELRYKEAIRSCLLFCVSKWGWGFDNYLAETNTGTGMQMPRWIKPYVQFVLPVLIFVILFQGLLPG